LTIFCVYLLDRFSHRYEEKYYEDSRVDAVAMERLTSSSFVTNIYGFCGLTVVQEYGGNDLTRVLAGNKMNSYAKLNLAKQIAQGLYHVHSVPDDDDEYPQQTTLVHNDINLANLLFTTDNRPMLNDFNIAKLVMRHSETGHMCSFNSQFPNPQWKSPEEQVIYEYHRDGTIRHETALTIVNEKVDIYALGNVYYRMLTGLNPWRRPDVDRLYDEDKATVARLKKFHGAIPPIPKEIIVQAQTDSSLSAILNVMRLCYRFDPNERPSAAEVVKYFDDALSNITNTKMH
jgi:serine/threonine protein kinase